MDIVFGIILLVASVFLVVAVLMQSGKAHNLSGTIAGGAETFFGKTKGKAIDQMLSKLTTIVAIVFTILVIVVYVIQPDTAVNYDQFLNDYLASESASTAETAAEESVAPADVADINATGETTAEGAE